MQSITFIGLYWETEQTWYPLRRLLIFGPSGLLVEEVYRDEVAASPKAEWCGWVLLAEAAKQNIIQRWEDYKDELAEWRRNGSQGDAPTFKPNLAEDLWRGFRDWMKRNVFHNKCAYCESPLTGYPGDTKHFRPKGRVSVRRADGTLEPVSVVDVDGEEITHPGYFWLAYNWLNLLPSCEYCNTAGGKKDLFPVRASNVAFREVKGDDVNRLIDKLTKSEKFADIYYLEPRDLDKIESRLLLHPTLDEPERHIYFDTEGDAHEWCDSEEGKASIKIYDLNEKTKRDARQAEQVEARERYAVRVIASKSDKVEDLKRMADDFFSDYRRGPKPYAAAVFDFLHERFEFIRYDPARLLGERREKCGEEA